MNQQNSPDAKLGQNLPLLFTISAVAAITVFISFRVIFIVFVASKNRFRPANTLVAHLSFVVIIFTFVMFLFILGQSHVSHVVSPGICNILTFMINGIYNVFSLNIGAIVWVRVRSNAIVLRRSAAYRLMAIMWATTLTINLLSLFTVESVTSSDTNLTKCRPVPLFGSSRATLAYEGFRLLFFNVAVCLYLIRASIILKTSMRHIRLLKGEWMTRRVKKVRFVHMHTIVLIFAWFPHGLLLFLFKISAPLDWTTIFTKYVAILIMLGYTVFTLCPLSYVFMLEDVSIAKFFVSCFLKNTYHLPVFNEDNGQNEPKQYDCRVDTKTNLQSKLHQIEKNVTWSKKTGVKIQGNYNFERGEMSFLTTVGLTATSNTSSQALPQFIWSEPSSFVQACSIPTLMTPSTSTKLQTFVVEAEVHAQPRNAERESEVIFSERNTETLI